MTVLALSKELLLSLARQPAARQFTFLAPIRTLVQAPPPAVCPTCPKKKTHVFLDDNLYRGVLNSAAFTRETASLKGFLQVDQLLIPGVPVPV